MQSARIRADRSRAPWRVVWVAALGIALVAALGAFRFARSQPHYLRFVSRPLPDGSRYTFLYPRNLQRIREGGGNPGVIANVRLQSGGAINESPSLWDRLQRLMGLPVPYPGESVTVMGYRPKGRISRNSRRHDRWTRGDEVRHNEFIQDSCSQLEFSIYHSCYTYSASRAAAAAQVEAHGFALVRSFEILPPGSPVPTR